MRGWWQDLTDLVLPAECGGCGRPRTVLCEQCRAALSGGVARRVRPLPEPAGLPAVHAAAGYQGAVRAVLLAHKERGALALATPLGSALAGAVRAGLSEADGAMRPAAGEWADTAAVPGAGEAWAGTQRAVGTEPGEGRAAAVGTVLLVPVPSARRAVRARGHDPARRIALAAARELRRTGTPARVVAALRQRRAVADQAGLKSRQRVENLGGALVVAPGAARLLTGGAVVLVDDLMTTGASLAEAARAVRAASEVVPDACAGAPSAVYAAVAREGRRGRTTAVTEEAMDGPVPRPPGRTGAEGSGDVVCAAVVAASPGSFEINRN